MLAFKVIASSVIGITLRQIFVKLAQISYTGMDFNHGLFTKELPCE
jgi:hypothetical protein